MAMEFDYPSPESETEIVAREGNIDEATARDLVTIGQKVRNLRGHGLEEGVSTRLLVYTGTLIRGGMKVDRALEAAIIEPLTDDADTQQALRDLAATVFG